ncbi:hypothetical protein lerEdw1_010516 [Lerista edwardsae]|nr:hypothetical protein lerEdw1_010516 [Lerista edwardsae]
MAAKAGWRYRGDPQEGQSAPLVQFTNGKLKSPENMDFTLYKSKDANNPRKKHRRTLNTETERLSYVGNNFGPGALKCNTLCKYFVGVLDKNSGHMEVYNAELFNMQPLISDNVADESLSEYLTKSYREKVDLCIEAFGTKKQKRALNSRRMNEVGKEVLNKAVIKAAEDVIETKGVAVISPEEYEALQVPAAAFTKVTSAEIAKMMEENSHCFFVLDELQSMPLDEKSRDHKARCLCYLDYLVKLSLQRVVKKKNAMGPDCPHVITIKLLKTFTVLSYTNGRINNQVSASMKAKIAAHTIALALHINNFQADLTILQRDLKLRESRILDIAKAMRLKITKGRGLLGLDEHKLGILTVPLPVCKMPSVQRRRKMK